MDSQDKVRIHIIITGGTIDSAWDGAQDTAVVSKESILPEYFTRLKLNDDVTFTTVCMKDSRALDANDRGAILKTVAESETNKIVITHGTYTMPDTAKYLKAQLTRSDQTIVLTGSMTPMKGFDLSDAAFNLGYAIAQVKTQPAGVYLCMNATCFSPEEVAKDLAEGKFYSVFSAKQ